MRILLALPVTWSSSVGISTREARLGCAVVLAMLMWGVGGGEVSAASPQDAAPPKTPDPETVDITTRDGYILKGTWFPSPLGKEAVPVILLHDWEGDRSQVAKLAGYLQSSIGCAVLTPDLRHHGESRAPDASAGDDRRNRQKPEQFAMAIEDIEACKRFLVKRNNLGELNINLLVVIADRRSSLLAADWTIRDWSYKELGGIKQGQDVKAIVLVSPALSFMGVNMANAVKADVFAGRTVTPISLLILTDVGDAEAAADSDTIKARLDRERRAAKRSTDDVELVEFRKKDTGWVTTSGETFNDKIADFIQRRVVSRQQELRWQNRDQ